MEVNNRKAMDLKIVADERVVDGYYFATALKLSKKLLTNPQELMTPPESVIIFMAKSHRSCVALLDRCQGYT